jgi:hypothetical protein
MAAKKKKKAANERRLSAKQAKFAAEYVVDHNGAQAAIRAGYSKKTAVEQASRLLTKVHVQDEVKRLERARIEKLNIKAEDVLAGLYHEATTFGEGSTSSARVRAWELIGRTIPGFFPPENAPATPPVILQFIEVALQVPRSRDEVIHAIIADQSERQRIAEDTAAPSVNGDHQGRNGTNGTPLEPA